MHERPHKMGVVAAELAAVRMRHGLCAEVAIANQPEGQADSFLPCFGNEGVG